ncbi:MAG: hypothetical protein JXB13_00985 [Phycisphaerae bacterium]|nr:hypothetical protein [Phycisphaerae bacterium]
MTEPNAGPQAHAEAAYRRALAEAREKRQRDAADRKKRPGLARALRFLGLSVLKSLARNAAGVADRGPGLSRERQFPRP